MKANHFDCNESGQAKAGSLETLPLRIEEVNSFVEEHEDAIADEEEITIRAESTEDLIARSSAASHKVRSSGSK